MIEIYCDEPSHDGRVADIARFVGEHGRWHMSSSPKEADRLHRTRQPGDVFHGTSPELVHYRADDVALLMDRTPSGTPVGALPAEAATFSVRCALCGLTVTARHDTIAPILDKLHNAGVCRLSLRVLGTTL